MLERQARDPAAVGKGKRADHDKRQEVDRRRRDVGKGRVDEGERYAKRRNDDEKRRIPHGKPENSPD